jgi:uncharacterized protein YpuA (DUF1002 family)
VGKVEKKDPGDLLKKLSKKSGEEWDMNKVKSLAKGFSAKDLKNDDKITDLIKKVAKSVGVSLSDEKLEKVKTKLDKKMKK